MTGKIIELCNRNNITEQEDALEADVEEFASRGVSAPWLSLMRNSTTMIMKERATASNSSDFSLSSIPLVMIPSRRLMMRSPSESKSR